MDNTRRIGEYLDRVIEEIDDLDRMREETLRLNRKLNRRSGRGIALLVRGQDDTEIFEETHELMGQIGERMTSLERLTGWSPLVSGVEEYCEYRILRAVLTGTEVPLAEELLAPKWIWVVALGDVVGELRRFVLTKLLDGEREVAARYLGWMEVIYTMIAGLEFPKAITGSLRNKVDVARAILERTQSDLLNSRP